MKRTPLRRTASLRRSKGVKRVNASRKAAEFARTYHSEARVRFVKALPCAACGVTGFSENAHVVNDGSKGAGRKSGYRGIAPLCGPRPASKLLGCHRLFDTMRVAFLGSYADFNPEHAAQDTEKLWQKVSA